jgi:hypothetical protein
VNGYLAELFLKRGLNYTFIIEAGQNNSFYISDEPFGGFYNLEENEKKLYTVYAPKNDLEESYSERLCVWEGLDPYAADKFSTFEDFRQKLNLNCLHHGAGLAISVHFNPDNSTPSTIYANVI